MRSRNSDLINSTQKIANNGSTRSDQVQQNSSNNNSLGVQTWGSSFEKMLEDAAGLHTFAVFLRKEFSAENIYFWTACERYRQIENHTDRAKEANEIFSRHLRIGAGEAVNVDSKARTIAEDNLSYADRDLFLQVCHSVN